MISVINKSAPLPRYAHLHSLGCPKNLVDSEVMLGQLAKLGIEVCETPDDADLIIVNTCSFIDPAKRESVDAILNLAKYKQDGVCRALVVSGCLPQHYHGALKQQFPEVDAFLGPGECNKIGKVVRDVWNRVGGTDDTSSPPQRIFQYASPRGRPRYLYDHETPRLLLTPRHYAYVKIAEGCNNACKFCVIGRLRGPYRSRRIESILVEVRNLVQRGVKEVILVAQDTTDYGMDLYKTRRLPNLLEMLHSVAGLQWIRLLYTHPAHITEDLIRALAQLPKVCKYLDIPVQHCTDPMLLRMGRRLDWRQTKGLIERLRRQVLGLAVRTSLIVGLPGETGEIFQELYREVQTMRFERLGVFTYSKEEGTTAGLMKGQVGEAVKKKRRAMVMACQQKISREINEQLVGKILDVRVDCEVLKKKGIWTGRTQWDAPKIDNRVFVEGQGLCPGDLIKVKIIKASAYDLAGIPVSKSCV